jgi:hypothetical protein
LTAASCPLELPAGVAELQAQVGPRIMPPEPGSPQPAADIPAGIQSTLRRKQ